MGRHTAYTHCCKRARCACATTCGAALAEHVKLAAAGMIGGPIGTFHARSAKDAEAPKRDGWPYFAISRLDEGSKRPAERDLFEIRSEDGLWMLARLDDLVAAVPGVGGSRN